MWQLRSCFLPEIVFAITKDQDSILDHFYIADKRIRGEKRAADLEGLWNFVFQSHTRTGIRGGYIPDKAQTGNTKTRILGLNKANINFKKAVFPRYLWFFE